MRASRERRTNRALQIGFLVVLGISLAQATWWILDQVRYANAVKAKLVGHFQQDVLAANDLLPAGVSRSEIRRLFPHLTIAGRPPRAALRPAAEEALERERWHRINRYGWEGLFFLCVLAAGMVVISRALKQDLVLRRRQQSFLAAVSHEFKSPLSSLKLSVETLELRDPPAASRRRIVERMTRDIQRLEAMVTNILDTTRIEEGRAAYEPKRLELAPVVTAVADGFRERADRAGAAIAVEMPDGLRVEADPVAFRAVLANLVDNAVKAVRAAERERGTVTVRAAREGKFVRLEVLDDGIGFAPRERKRIFEKFYRSGEELRRRTRGSGLGLYIVRRVMETAGGKFAAASRGPGRGATFTVHWPAGSEGES